MSRSIWGWGEIDMLVDVSKCKRIERIEERVEEDEERLAYILWGWMYWGWGERGKSDVL